MTKQEFWSNAIKQGTVERMTKSAKVSKETPLHEIRVYPDDFELAKDLARETGMSVAEVIRLALGKHAEVVRLALGKLNNWE